jgi:hypothetical protein
MKHIYLFLFSCIASSAFAQITLTSANAPAPGSVWAFEAIDTTGITTGPSGASVSWDYSTFAIDTAHSSTTYISATGTTYASSFPSATVAVASGTGFVYYAVTGTSYNLLGSKTSTGGVSYSDNEQLMSFPFTYTNTFSDNFRGHTVGAGLPDSIIGTNMVTSDAWGTLKVPGGTTYPNALRVKTTETYVDSIIGFTGFHYTTVTYYWYVSTQNKPVFYLQYFSTYPSSNPSQLYKSKAAGLNYTPVAGILEHTISIGMQVFPNPVSNGSAEVHFTLKEGGATSISLLNALGQEVMTSEKEMLLTGSYTEQMPTAALAKGIYLVRIQCGTEIATQKLLVN